MNTPDMLREESMRRMRWRLWFAFMESGYKSFRIEERDKKGNLRVKPDYDSIKKYCLKYWNKEIKDMTDQELSERIATVKKWK